MKEIQQPSKFGLKYILKAYKLLFLFIFSFYTNSLFPQQTDPMKVKKEKNLRITPLPVIYYSPETRLGIGALVAANFMTVKKNDSITKGSYAQSYIIYTLNKQYDVGNQVRLYSPQNKYIVFAKVNYKYFPQYYYGNETEEPILNKDSINFNIVTGDFRFYKKVNKNLYAGFNTRLNKVSNVFSGEGSFERDKMPGYQGYWIAGFAPAITIESRDNYVNPLKGFYLEAVYFFYPSWKGKSYAFRQIKLDVRKYYTIHYKDKKDVLAFQFLANINTGVVPFKDMADIGGQFTMRGYYTGFYKYKNLYAFQAEYRSQLWKSLGVVVWLGAALTPKQWYTFADNPFKPNAGIGLRIMINKNDRLNLRLDQGFGKMKQRGFYLDIAEAF